jgi:hypothetical protein
MINLFAILWLFFIHAVAFVALVYVTIEVWDRYSRGRANLRGGR